jgi:hypothetical protein
VLDQFGHSEGGDDPDVDWAADLAEEETEDRRERDEASVDESEDRATQASFEEARSAEESAEMAEREAEVDQEASGGDLR